MIPCEGEYRLLMSHSSHLLFLAPLRSQCEYRLEAIDQIEVPHLHHGVHGADGHEVALGILARFVAEPLQGEGEGGQQDIVVNIQRLLNVVVNCNLCTITHKKRIELGCTSTLSTQGKF